MPLAAGEAGTGDDASSGEAAIAGGVTWADWAAAHPVESAALMLAGALLLAFPTTWLLAASVALNLALGFAVRLLSQQAALREEENRRPHVKPCDATAGSLLATAGLQHLMDESWEALRTWLGAREFEGIVRRVDIGERPPVLTSVRTTAAPALGVTCYDVDVALGPSEGLPLVVDIDVPLAGRASLVALRLSLTRFEGTVQFYFWSTPPPGRGNGRPYSLIEAALASEPSLPLEIAVQAEGLSQSVVLNQILPTMQQVAAAAIKTHLLPGITGFHRRVVVIEAREGEAVTTATSWQDEARRAGWFPRAEAELEVAVSEILTTAGTYAMQTAAEAHGRLSQYVGREAGQWAQRIVTDAAASVTSAAAAAGVDGGWVSQVPDSDSAAPSSNSAAAAADAALAAVGEAAANAASLFGASRTFDGDAASRPLAVPASTAKATDAAFAAMNGAAASAASLFVSSLGSEGEVSSRAAAVSANTAAVADVAFAAVEGAAASAASLFGASLGSESEPALWSTKATAPSSNTAADAAVATMGGEAASRAAAMTANTAAVADAAFAAMGDAAASAASHFGFSFHKLRTASFEQSS